MKARHAGILAAVLGSICCVGPSLLIAIGLGTGAAVLGRCHRFFIGGAIAVLAWAWVKHFREKTECACEHPPMKGRGISMFTLILASGIVLAFIGLNLRSYAFAGPPPTTPTANTNLQRVVIPVEGMTCATCEIVVRHALRRIEGVKSVDVSAATKTATVDYEPMKANPEKLVETINSTGYHASLPNK
jgi:mercuric ion transport protein